MKTVDINYRFMIRHPNEVALQTISILKNYEYLEIDKKSVVNAYGLTKFKDNEINFNNIIGLVENKLKTDEDKLMSLCYNLQKLWNENKKELLTEITAALDINFDMDESYSACCKLHYLPINEIDDKNGCIYLNCNYDEETLFRNFVIMLVKSFLVVKLENLMGKGRYKYDSKNKIWILIEIAIDAVFANSKLNKWTESPSYNYFYNLKINGINIMEKFRKLHKLININDFLNNVYIFVCENYKTLIKFKSYLY